MFKSIDIFCDSCEAVRIQLVDVPSGQPLPDVVECEHCGGEARRLLSCQIAKKEIEEKVHGGIRLPNGKLATRMTGGREALTQARLRRAAKQAKKDGDIDVAREVQTELGKRAEEAKKHL